MNNNYLFRSKDYITLWTIGTLLNILRWADIILVIPTTANLMTKLTLGKAEDLATTVMLASNKEIILVPAMNIRMWLHKATQKNLGTLLDFGYKFIGPTTGEMA